MPQNDSCFKARYHVYFGDIIARKSYVRIYRLNESGNAVLKFGHLSTVDIATHQFDHYKTDTPYKRFTAIGIDSTSDMLQFMHMLAHQMADVASYIIRSLVQNERIYLENA